MTHTTRHELTASEWTLVCTDVKYAKIELQGHEAVLIHITSGGAPNSLEAPSYVLTPDHGEVDLNHIRKQDYVYARSKQGSTAIVCISDEGEIG